MTRRSGKDIHNAVRERYAGVASGPSGCGCGETQSGCCGSPSSADDTARRLGYSDAELAAAPEGANLGLGCGNPQAIASLRRGETVLDLGSGAGFDCFLAARAVGENGRVIGVDMTEAMVAKARENADRFGGANVEFRLGMIESIPADDDSVDVIMSNCVINLSPDKPAVYREAYRVLRSGGRLAVSDIVLTAPLPDELRDDMAMYTGCVAGASSIDEVKAMLSDAGFAGISVETREEVRRSIREWAPGRRLDDYIASATIQAVKP